MRYFTMCIAGLAALCQISVAQAGDFVCDGSPGSVKIDDDVVVLSGTVCTLDGTKVKDNVKVEPGGALKTLNANIGGNIQADEAAWIEIGEGTHVGGNVQIDYTSGVPGVGLPNMVCGATIKGDLQVTGNEAPFVLGCDSGNEVGGNLQVVDSDVPAVAAGDAIAITNNQVDGDLQFKKNSGESGDFDISGNDVGQNLQCSDNDPAPVGGDNVVGGDADDQCFALAIASGNDSKHEDLTCTATMGKEKYDDVTVSSGEECTLDGTKVKGNVVVESGGALTMLGAKVGGNIQADEADWIKIGEGTRVKGNVQIEQTTGTPAPGMPNEVCGVKIKGNLQVTKNMAPFDLGCGTGNKVKGNLQVKDNDIPDGYTGDVLAVTSNKVKGDLQFDNNTSTEGTFDISGNRVKQNLQCTDNSPAPTGGGNDVKGDTDDQCFGL